MADNTPFEHYVNDPLVDLVVVITLIQFFS